MVSWVSSPPVTLLSRGCSTFPSVILHRRMKTFHHCSSIRLFSTYSGSSRLWLLVSESLDFHDFKPFYLSHLPFLSLFLFLSLFSFFLLSFSSFILIFSLLFIPLLLIFFSDFLSLSFLFFNFHLFRYPSFYFLFLSFSVFSLLFLSLFHFVFLPL